MLMLFKNLSCATPLALLVVMSLTVISCGVKPGDLTSPTEQVESNKEYPLIYPKKETLIP